MSIFSKTLVDLRKRYNMSQPDLAGAIRVSVSHIERLETDYVEPDQATLESLAALFGVNVYYLTGVSSRQVTVQEPGVGSPRKKYLSVPVIGSRNASSLVIQESAIVDHVVLSLPFDNESDYIGILIDTDDVDCPRVVKGDVAIIKTTKTLHRGDLVAVSHDGGPVFFRYYQRSGPNVVLTSYKGKPDITYNVGDRLYNIIGKVIKLEINV